ncbi:MAG: choice-of-anchor D domain-containing protein [Myxococcota bacterium]
MLNVRTLHTLAVTALALSLWACPTQQTDDPEVEGGASEGSPCVADTDCDGMLCIGGTCQRQGASTSSGGSSGNASGSGGSNTSSTSGGGGDAGPTDAYVPAGFIELDPAEGPLEFGATRVGASVTLNVLVTNTGNAPASLISLAFRNNPSGEFTLSVVGGQPAVLNPNEQITVRITHAATDAAADHAFLSVVTNASNPLVELELVAEFKGDPALSITQTPDDTTEVTTWALDPTPVGTPVTGHLYVKNVGQADSALTISSVTLDPPASALFSVAAGPLPRAISSWSGLCVDLGGCDPTATECTNGLCLGSGSGGTLYPRDVVDVALTFNAGAGGEATTEVVIVADVAGTPTTRRIPVAALAQDSRLNVSPNPIAFGNVFVGRDKTLQVTLENPADATSVLNITDIGIRFTPSPYEVQLGGVSFPYPLTPGSSVVVAVKFSPQNPGNFGNSLAISREGGLPIYVPITGVGANEPDADVPASLDFGGVVPGTSKTLPLTIGNVGLGPLITSQAEVTPSGTPFTFTPATIPDVDANSSTLVQVTYAPPLEGVTDVATLLLQTNDPNQPVIQVQLSGQGVIPAAEVTPSGLDFGSVLVGTANPPTQNITVRNTGMGYLNVNSPLRVVNAGGANIPEYTVTASRTLPADVASGDAMTLTVRFAPSAATSYSGNLTITTNDPNRPEITVPVTGSGNNCTPLPNTSVTVVNGTQCAYQCVPDAVQCADQSCVICPQRHGATPSCTSGNACQYTCPANSGEPIDPPGTCNSGTAYNLGNIQDGSTQTTSNFRVYPGGDNDWFKFVAADRLGGFYEGVPFRALQVFVRLSGVPQGEQLAVELVQNTCGGGGTPVVVGAGQTGEVESPQWCDTYSVNDNGTPDNPDDDYTEPIDDSRTFYVHVYPIGDSYACNSYTLTVEVEEPFFSAFCF